MARLPDRVYLILDAGPSGRYVQFACDGPDGLRAETQSNDYAEPGERLSLEEARALVELGWADPPPGRARRTNFSRAWRVPVAYDEAAGLAVRTFRDVLGVRTPRALRYDAFHRGGGAYADPALGLAPAEPRRPRPRSRAFIPAPEGWDEMTPRERQATARAMARAFLAQLGLGPRPGRG